jgi:hypothetical protein
MRDGLQPLRAGCEPCDRMWVVRAQFEGSTKLLFRLFEALTSIADRSEAQEHGGISRRSRTGLQQTSASPFEIPALVLAHGQPLAQHRLEGVSPQSLAEDLACGSWPVREPLELGIGKPSGHPLRMAVETGFQRDLGAVQVLL